MAKRVNSASLKGKLEIDFNLGEGIVTENVKVGKETVEREFDFFKLLQEFNGKNVSIAIKEENDLEAIDEDFNVSSTTDGEEQEDFYVED